MNDQEFKEKALKQLIIHNEYMNSINEEIETISYFLMEITGLLRNEFEDKK